MNKISNYVYSIILSFPFFLDNVTTVLGETKCVVVEPIDNFNLNAIEGVWYEIARYPNDIEGDLCIGYDLRHNGTDLTFTSVGVPKDSPYYLVGVSKTESNHKGTLIHEVTDGGLERKIKFGEDKKQWAQDHDFMLVETEIQEKLFHGSFPQEGGSNSVQIRENIVLMDYEKYFISYECYFDEQSKMLTEFSWVYTRSKTPGDDVKSIISKFLKSSTVIDIKKLVWFDLPNESNCKIIDAPKWVEL